MGAGFGQGTLADHQASACLPCSAGAEMRRGYMFCGFVARSSKFARDHCAGVSSRCCQCLSCALSRCEHASSVSSWLSELTCHVRPDAFPSCSCLCLSCEPEQQLSPRAEAKFRRRFALFKRSFFVFYVLLELSCQDVTFARRADWFSKQMSCCARSNADWLTPCAALSVLPALSFACMRATKFRPCHLLGMSFMRFGRRSP